MGRLEQDKLMQQAAMVAHKFQIDPVDVLKSDRFTWAVRLAANNIVNTEMQKAKEIAAAKKRAHGHR